MKELQTVIHVVNAAQDVVEALRKLRSQCSDAQWDKLSDGPMGALLEACADLECEMGTDQE